jgi:acyl carrier protein
VREAAVLAHEDGSGGAVLVAYVVPADDQRPTTNDEGRRTKDETGAGDERRATNDETGAGSSLSGTQELSSAPALYRSTALPLYRSFLAERLPEYMVPSAFVALDRLPLTPNGKLDRAALPPWRAGEGQAPDEPPQGDVEQAVAEIWGQVLKIDVVGRQRSFFDLGGHSLLLVNLQVRLKEEMEMELPVVELFQFPTVRALAARLRDGAGGGGGGAADEGGGRGDTRQAALDRRREAARRRREA